ncbi:DUF1853 family protein [Gilvimarinus sp. 1_MG-2023]|uniref:DUF1853 family protein n=1 Tax=Gilvimarinus sp. 1_MG-2023 TaxID=3062638 RepID=UPI0026E44D65|nr:DUF1853 family protein [Gilvimarinus sp. 1_MG-2023]
MPINPWLEFVHSLRTPQVRDLAASCMGEHLLSTPLANGMEFYQPATNKDDICLWLKQQDDNPSLLLAHLAQRKSTRLGLYFESLWSFFWQAGGNTKILAHNLQIEHNKKTIGSLDYVIEENARFIHIEAAVKFYLLVGDNPQSYHHWIGPNANDSLGKKLDHLQGHQFPLLHKTTTQTVLARNQIDFGLIQQRLILKGALFWPGHRDLKSIANQGQYHNKSTAEYLWLPVNQLHRVDKKGLYTIIPRNRWIGPARLHKCCIPLTAPQLCAALYGQITYDGHPRMVAQLQYHQKGFWFETRRYCVVNNQWPGLE